MRILLTLVILLISTSSFASITFSQGKWETTFDCPEWEQNGSPTCDGIERGTDWYTSDGNKTAITSAANNPGGLGGRGARFWKGSGKMNNHSGLLGINFPTRQTEIWVRWYERYESGFSWAGTGAGAIDVKSLYFFDGAKNPYLGFYQHDSWRLNNQGVGDGSHLITSGGGWATIYTTPVSGRSNSSDGTWHCFEVYMKMDTASELGKAKFWTNGILVGETDVINFSGGDATARSGWHQFGFLSNQKDPGLDRDYYVDVDDMVIYNQTPPNRDAHGNPFIGPLPLAPPESLSITVEPQ